MSVFENKFAADEWPIAAADPTGKRGVFRYAASASSQSAAVPATWKGAEIVVSPIGANVQVAFGVGSAPTLNLNEPAAFGTGDVNSGCTVVDSRPQRRLVPPDATHIAWISPNTTGFVEFYRAECNKLQASK